MAINGISFGNTILGGSIQNLKTQMADLQNQLTSGKKSTTYSGMGANEGFAIAARAQLLNISAYTDTMTKINTNIGVANTALQALSNIGTQLQNAANSGSQALNSAGQTAGQQTAVAAIFVEWSASSIRRPATATFFPAARSTRSRWRRRT